MPGLPSEDVAIHISDNVEGVVYDPTGVATGPRIVLGKRSPPKPGETSETVFVEESTGLNDEAHHDGGIGMGIYRPGVMILTRSGKNRQREGLALHEQIADFLNRNPPPFYSDARLQGSAVNHLGPAQEGQEEFSSNFILEADKRPSPHYWGADTLPGAFDEAFIVALANTQRASVRFRRMIVNVGAGERMYYALPMREGISIVNVTPVTAGSVAQVAADVPLTHGSGADLYRVLGLTPLATFTLPADITWAVT